MPTYAAVQQAQLMETFREMEGVGEASEEEEEEEEEDEEDEEAEGS